MPPIVSVIIPCYNHAHYLSFAVNSVVAQTFADWEAIIVDDDSTDNTREVAARFADARVRYIYQVNRGLSGARNTGICHAQGKYLAFLDADDEWDVNFLTTCVHCLDLKTDAAAVFTRFHFIDTEERLLPSTGGCYLPQDQIRRHLLQGGFFTPNSILARANVLARVGVFDTSLTSVEDWDLWLRISEQHLMASLPDILARYRVYPGSMATNAARMYSNRMAVLAKHFGPPEGVVVGWPDEKRCAYAFAYRITALGCIAQDEMDEGWRYIRQAAETYPGLLARLDTFYELACGNQPRGYRGYAKTLDIAANGEEMLRRLDALFASASPPIQALKGAAYGNAYLALAMLSDQARDWSAARRYIRSAITAYPKLLWSAAAVRRLLKLHTGQRIIQLIRPDHLPLRGEGRM